MSKITNILGVVAISAIGLSIGFLPAICTKKDTSPTPHRITVLLSGNDVPRLEVAAAKAYANGDTLAGDALMSVANTNLYYFYPTK